MALLRAKKEPLMQMDYDTISAKYDGFRGVDADLARVIGSEAALFAGARVLDIGCGTGNIEAALAETVDLEVVGVDLSFGMLAEAKAKVPRASWIQADSSRLPLRDEAFDFALMLYMLHHLTDFRAVIRNAHAALRGGRLVIVTASHKQIGESFSSRFFPSYAAIDKARFPKVSAIVEAMIEAGFSDVSSRAITVAKVTLDDRYIEKVENKHVSTFHIMNEREFRSGLKEMKSYIVAHAGASPLEHKGTLIVGRKTAKR
jgi:SAM-dependent methyltransferase